MLKSINFIKITIAIWVVFINNISQFKSGTAKKYKANKVYKYK